MNQHSETTVLDDFIIVTDAQRSALQRRGVKDLYSLLECVVEAHGPAEDVGLPAEVVAVYKRHLINWIRDYGLGAYVDLLAANGAGRIRLFGQFPNQVVAAWSEAAAAAWRGGGATTDLASSLQYASLQQAWGAAAHVTTALHLSLLHVLDCCPEYG